MSTGLSLTSTHEEQASLVALLVVCIREVGFRVNLVVSAACESLPPPKVWTLPPRFGPSPKIQTLQGLDPPPKVQTLQGLDPPSKVQTLQGLDPPPKVQTLQGLDAPSKGWTLLLRVGPSFQGLNPPLGFGPSSQGVDLPKFCPLPLNLDRPERLTSVIHSAAEQRNSSVCGRAAADVFAIDTAPATFFPARTNVDLHRTTSVLLRRRYQD